MKENVYSFKSYSLFTDDSWSQKIFCLLELGHDVVAHCIQPCKCCQSEIVSNTCYQQIMLCSTHIFDCKNNK